MHAHILDAAPIEGLLITLTDVHKSYTAPGGMTQHALRGLSLCVARGEYLALLGKSGSGKSTVLNMIAGLDEPSAGLVKVDGVEPSSMRESARAPWRGARVGVVFQFFQLLPTLTVAENILLAMEFVRVVPKAERRARAYAGLAAVGIADHADKLPHQLSGGQQQRAAIARALANDPPILLADEPTGNLDTETAAAIGELLLSLAAHGKTIVTVTHDRTMAAVAHRIVTLQDGRVQSAE